MDKLDHTISPSFELLCQAIRLDNAAEAALQAENILKAHAIDWDDVHTRADFHNVKPQLGLLLQKISPRLVPDNVKETLREANQQVAYQQLRNVAEFFRVKAVLDEAGIPAIPFKGFWLAHSLYGNIAARESVDIDVYIHLEDLERIIPLMPGLGYQHETSSSPRFLEVVKKTSSEYNFDKFEGQERISHLEFHWKLGSYIHGLDISLNDLNNQIQNGEMQNRAFPVFSSSANLLLAVMHHGGKDPMIKLRQILDVGYFLSRCTDIDWQWVLMQARRYDVEMLVYLGMRLASLLTGIQIPEALRDKTQTKKIAGLADERMHVMAMDPESWYGKDFNRRNFVFQLRTRKRLKIRWMMLYNLYRSRVFRLLTPKFVMKVYLKTRYGINRGENV